MLRINTKIRIFNLTSWTITEWWLLVVRAQNTHLGRTTCFALWLTRLAINTNCVIIISLITYAVCCLSVAFTC